MAFELSQENLQQYEVMDHRFLPDINSDSYILRHKKTGARIALLPNEDTNKVFYIGFRTPPTDSTGVAHIIEHTVLCGSEHFPVKDPFVELVKGSLNTFLNAMTYPDKTVYPVASTNPKDFANLMHVYLDAVFHPLIYRNESIFRQEGWHYEWRNSENDASSQELIINGVVYNEMKGAFSSPDDVLARRIYETLLPDTPYAVESGGDPDCIPELTYEAYLDFHRRYYHPSNSYIYLYGDADMNERLAFLDAEYLSHYERLEIDSALPVQRSFEAPVETTIRYPILEEEDPSGKTYFALNYAFPPFDEQKCGKSGASAGAWQQESYAEAAERNMAFKILDYVLSDAEGSPLTEALHEQGIGEDIYSMYENGLRQPCYSIIAKYCDADQKEAFAATIENTLRTLAEQGIRRKSLAAAISYYEFRYRESDFGSYPKGLALGLNALDTWLYDDLAPWVNLDAGRSFDELRRKAEEGYFEELIRTYLLDNPHRSLVVMEPEPGLEERREEALRIRLREKAAGMSQEEKQRITDQEAALRAWQETPDSEEAMQTIPLLKRSDLTRACTPYANRIETLDEDSRKVTLVTHPVFTNGIDYLSLIFDAGHLTEEEFRLLPALKTLLGVVDTELHDYLDLNEEINILTGGIHPSVSTYTNAADTKQYRVTFELHVKALHEHLSDAFSLMEEILLHSRFDTYRRVREVLEEERAGMRADLAASGHITAATRALSYFSETSKLIDDVSGIGAYRTLDEICNTYEDCKESLAMQLTALARKLAGQGELIADLTANEENTGELNELVQRFLAAVKETEDTAKKDEIKDRYQPVCSVLNEGLITAGQVQYVCRAGNYLQHGYSYTGALRVLRVILGYDYLWTRVRMKGGAYGCMSSFSRDGSAFLVSYRDPNLAETIEVYREAGEYIRQFTADERTMTKYIIGAVSALDHPMTPHQYGRYSLTGYLTNYSAEQMQRERDQVLDADEETIRGLGSYLDAMMGDEIICVVGTKDRIEAAGDNFSRIGQLV